MLEELKTKYETELQYLETVFSENGISANESILVVQINKAYTAIRNYLRMDDSEDATAYFDTAVDLATVYYNNYMVTLNKTAGKKSVSQQTQGSRSITYSSGEIVLDAYGLTEAVKAVLPYPPIRVF